MLLSHSQGPIASCLLPVSYMMLTNLDLHVNLAFLVFFHFPLAPAYLYAVLKNCLMSAVLPSCVDTESSMDWTSTSTRMSSLSTGSGSFDIVDRCAFLANSFSDNLNILNTIILHSLMFFIIHIFLARDFFNTCPFDLVSNVQSWGYRLCKWCIIGRSSSIRAQSGTLVGMCNTESKGSCQCTLCSLCSTKIVDSLLLRGNSCLIWMYKKWVLNVRPIFCKLHSPTHPDGLLMDSW